MSVTAKKKPFAIIIMAASLWMCAQTGAGTAAVQRVDTTRYQSVIAKIVTVAPRHRSMPAQMGLVGTYAVAATYNLVYLQDAERQFQNLDTWLVSNGLYSPFVNNASAAYNVHGTVRRFAPSPPCETLGQH